MNQIKKEHEINNSPLRPTREAQSDIRTSQRKNYYESKRT
jgi:hypothetical protein